MFPNRIQKTFYATFSWSIIVHGLVLQVPLPDPSCLYVFNTIQRKKDTSRIAAIVQEKHSDSVRVQWLLNSEFCDVDDTDRHGNPLIAPGKCNEVFYLQHLVTTDLSTAQFTSLNPATFGGKNSKKDHGLTGVLFDAELHWRQATWPRCVCPQPGQERSKLPAG